MSKTIDLFSNLGVPLAVDKQEGPTSCITFLGIEINSADMSLRLPSDRRDTSKDFRSSLVVSNRSAAFSLQKLDAISDFVSKFQGLCIISYFIDTRSG